MEISRDHIQASKPHLTDTINHAPVAVFGAMIGLADPADVIASMAGSDDTDGTVTWRAIWLTKDSLVYVDAAKDARDWDLASHETQREPDHIDAWRRPLSSIKSLGIQGARMTLDFGEWHAALVYRLAFDDCHVTVPLFGQLPRSRRADDCTNFIAVLQERLP